MKKGFTLIELLVVITIIGILATGATAIYSGAQAKARDATRQAAVQSMYTAQTYYLNDNSTYSVTSAALAQYVDKLPDSTGLKSDTDGATGASKYVMTANTSTATPRVIVGACGMKGATGTFYKSANVTDAVTVTCTSGSEAVASAAELVAGPADGSATKGTQVKF